MLTPPGYRKKLLADVQRWAEAGLISRTAADTITDEYKTDSTHAIVTVLAFLFAILAAAGLIALVAANWQDIPRAIRVAGLLSINLAVLGACLAFSLARKTGSIAIESSAALSVMSAAASISLTGQIYHFPSNWPGFALAMMCVAGATALIARSSACLWLAAVAQVAYYAANLSDTPGGLFSTYGIGSAMGRWTQQDWIFFSFSVVLIAIAVSRWTARSGAWTVFVAALPLLWWLDSLGFIPAASGRGLAWTACGIVLATILAHELRSPDRSESAISALIGLFAVGIAVRSFQSFGLTTAMLPRGLGLVAWQGQLAIAAAAVLAIAAGVRFYADRATVFWLAAALAAPFIANFVLPTDPRGVSALSGSIRLVVMVLLPLLLLAVEARLSERRKTFAFVIAAVIAIVCYHVWESKDLLTLAWVFLGGSAVVGAAILVSRTFSAQPRAPAGEGAA
jgi:uncharacterized membrane protein